MAEVLQNVEAPPPLICCLLSGLLIALGGGFSRSEQKMLSKRRSNLTPRLLQLRSISSGTSGGGILFLSRNSTGGGLLSTQYANRQLSPARCFSSGRHPTTRPMHWGFKIVPEGTAAVVERFGKYERTLHPGFHLLLPFVDKITHIHDLKEEVIPIPGQPAITKDDIDIHVDGTLYVKIVDPKMASYGVVEDPLCSVIQLAHSTIGIEIRKLTLRKIFAQKNLLNQNIMKSINEATKGWGLQCLRYDIGKISLPDGVKAALEMQALAKRKKRVQNLDLEGRRRADINIAKGNKTANKIVSEGKAESIRVRAQAEEVANATVRKALDAEGGIEAASLMAAEKAFSKLAEKRKNDCYAP